MHGGNLHHEAESLWHQLGAILALQRLWGAHVGELEARKAWVAHKHSMLVRGERACVSDGAVSNAAFPKRTDVDTIQSRRALSLKRPPVRW